MICVDFLQIKMFKSEKKKEENMKKNWLTPFWKNLPQPHNKDSFLSLHNEINRIFENFRDRFPLNIIDNEFLTPSINIKEKEKQYEITAELPGVEEKDVDVSIANNELHIYATKSSEKKEDKENYHLRECIQGSFGRSITLPYDANVEDIDAKIKNGILKIYIAKTAENKEKIKKVTVHKGQ